MSTTTDTSMDVGIEAYHCLCRQSNAAHFAYDAIRSLLDGDPDAATMRTVLRRIQGELRLAGVGR